MWQPDPPSLLPLPSLPEQTRPTKAWPLPTLRSHLSIDPLQHLLIPAPLLPPPWPHQMALFSENVTLLFFRACVDTQSSASIPSSRVERQVKFSSVSLLGLGAPSWARPRPETALCTWSCPVAPHLPNCRPPQGGTLVLLPRVPSPSGSSTKICCKVLQTITRAFN